MGGPTYQLDIFAPNQGNKQFAFCFFAAFGISLADQSNSKMS